MNAPLWRFVLHIMLLAFAIQRGAAALMLYLSNAPALLIATAAVPVLVAVVVSITVLLGRFVSGSLVALAVVLALAAVVQVAVVGEGAAVPALFQSIFGVGCALAMRHFIRRAEQDPEAD